jgi:hypothetical protein
MVRVTMVVNLDAYLVQIFVSDNGMVLGDVGAL